MRGPGVLRGSLYQGTQRRTKVYSFRAETSRPASAGSYPIRASTKTSARQLGTIRKDPRPNTLLRIRPRSILVLEVLGERQEPPSAASAPLHCGWKASQRRWQYQPTQKSQTAVKDEAFRVARTRGYEPPPRCKDSTGAPLLKLRGTDTHRALPSASYLSEDEPPPRDTSHLTFA